jgi:hypothetical protein
VYGEAELAVILPVWRASGEPCGKRLAPLLKLWQPWLESSAEPGQSVRTRVLEASPATLDRLLREHRTRPAARPRAGSEVRRQVPLREHPATAAAPGWL